MTIETTQSPSRASNWCVSRARPSRARAPPSSRLATPKSQTPLRLTDAVLAQRSWKCPETRTPRRIPRGHPTLREEDGVPSGERVRREAGLRRRNDIRERATKGSRRRARRRRSHRPKSAHALRPRRAAKPSSWEFAKHHRSPIRPVVRGDARARTLPRRELDFARRRFHPRALAHHQSSHGPISARGSDHGIRQSRHFVDDRQARARLAAPIASRIVIVASRAL